MQLFKKVYFWGCKMPNTCPCILGTHVVIYEDLHLTKVLLEADSENAITRNWINVISPKQQQWRDIVHSVFVMGSVDISYEAQRKQI